MVCGVSEWEECLKGKRDSGLDKIKTLNMGNSDHISVMVLVTT